MAQLYPTINFYCSSFQDAPDWGIVLQYPFCTDAVDPDLGPGGWGQCFWAYAGQSPDAISKNLGGCDCSEGTSQPLGEPGPGGLMFGDPINAATGNKYIRENDFSGGKWLSFDRFYNSMPVVVSGAAGENWRHSYSQSLEINNSTPKVATAIRADGRLEKFQWNGDSWLPDPGVIDSLSEVKDFQGNVIGYTLEIASTQQFESYGLDGRLLSIFDRQGVKVSLSYSTAETDPSIAPHAGLLLSVTDGKGRQLTMAYSGDGHLKQLVLPDGGAVTYFQDSVGNLVQVKYPDGSSKTYYYNESTYTGGLSMPHALTGIVDEQGVRYETTRYNYQEGFATYSSQSNGINAVTINWDYDNNGDSLVRNALGRGVLVSFNTTHDIFHSSGVNAPCGLSCGQPWQLVSYDVNGHASSLQDFKGVVTNTTYDQSGLLTKEIDGSGTNNQRTIETSWNEEFREPLQRSVLDASGNTVADTAWVYNTRGQPLARCDIDPTQAGSYACSASGTVPAGVRRWTTTYCDAVDGTQCPLVGLRLSATGPRTDLTQTTTYRYYMDSVATGCGTLSGACHQPGDLYQVIDPMGHVTTIASYDADGRITRTIDANGINTDLTYTPRGWLASRSIGGATTTLGYTPYGAVASITDPDNVTTTFTYDAAHRLTDITDAQGNRLHYTLDAAGDKTQEQVLTAAGTVVRNLSRSYNALGQVTAVIDGLSQTVFSAGTSGSYDGNGNLVHSTDALGIQHQQGFDALNRLQSTIANYNGTDPATSNTQMAFDYDALDRLDGVADPDGLDTVSTYDGLGNRTELASPDTGTSTDTYDAAGNRLTHTDAKGTVSTSTYDALNRLTGTTYADSTLNVSYAYDEPDTVTGCSGTSPIGRLTRVVEGSVSTVYCYDGRGNITRKQQVTSSQTDTTDYAYTAGNRLSGESTPNQTAIQYTYDSNGRISSVQATPSGATTVPPTVVSHVSYLPFGPIRSYTLSNGQTITRTYDANYRLTDLTSPALNLHFARDAMGNIVALGNGPGANPTTETYSYDPLYRLTGITDAGTALESYTYNLTGDRLSKTAPGLATGAYLYTTGTHQLASIGNVARANDADGNTTASVVGGNTYGFAYNGRNRLMLAQLNGQTVGTYTYNALGQRIGKTTGTDTERFAYDEAGHLIGEYGTTNRDYVWLGDIPVAVIDNTISGGITTSTVNYVTADQLGTPRVVTDGTGTVIWSWAYQGNPFGEQPPTSTTGYVLNLRYPGQYYDAESNTNYNVFRTYEAATGRYLQPDPIGLNGGISAFGYVGGNPLRYMDSLGLQAEEFDPKAEAALNTPDTNAEIKYLDESAAEAARARDTTVYPSRRPASEFGEFGHCDAVKPITAQVGPVGGVYGLYDPVTSDLVYIGRTNDFARRKNQHANDPTKGDFNFAPISQANDYTTQRGLEQTYLNVYDPPLNRINGISPSNPNYDTYIDAAQSHLNNGGH